MKKKMDFMTKAKLIYSGELAIFALAFLVLSILEFLRIMKVNGTVFNWITLFGGSWLIIDFIWAILDKKRQKRIALIDKILTLPLGIFLISFDLYCLIAQPADKSIYSYAIGSVFAYLCLVYTFQAIYHFKYPVPGLLDIEAKANQVVSEQEAEVVEEENKELPQNEEEVNNENKED